MLLDARPYVEEKIKELKERVNKLNKQPKLVIIRVGNDFASGKYVANKVKRCEEVGIKSEIVHLDENVTNGEVLKKIMMLNNDRDVTGILLQLPLPEHLNEEYLTNAIDPEKDVDGFTIANMGRLALGIEGNVACTPRGIISLLKYYNVELQGKNVLIINRSNIVGKPLTHLLLRENATVTVAHSKTKDLYDQVLAADIVVTAIGKAEHFDTHDFSKDTTIVDVSINFNEEGKMCGDVRKSHYDTLIEELNCNVTPVPNGVGQMTVIELIEQTIEIAERTNNGN